MTQEGDTALHLAAKNPKAEGFIQALIGANARLDIKDKVCICQHTFTPMRSNTVQGAVYVLSHNLTTL